MSLALAKADASDIRDLATSIVIAIGEGRVSLALGRAREIKRLADSLETRLEQPAGRGRIR